MTTNEMALTGKTPATNADAYTYRDQLDMLDFIGDYDFNASQASDAEWVAVIKKALAAGWTRNG